MTGARIGDIADELIECTSIGDRQCIVQKKRRCFTFNCGKCGQLLECYVNTGDSIEDDLVSQYVTQSSPTFCAAGLFQGQQVRTPCGQQCDQQYGTRVIVGSNWRGCPVATIGDDQCNGGAGRDGENPAALSNFASYTICLAADDSVESLTCAADKCDTGTCTCL